MFLSNQNLLPWINEILDNVTPDTKDKQNLNVLSSRQIVDSSYLENELVGSAFDANFLVPRHLHELKLNQVWRYPPLIYFEFLAKIDKNSLLKLKIRYAVPRFIRYGERRFIASVKKGSVRTFPMITTPKVKIPSDFGDVELFGRKYNLTYDGEFKPKTVTPKLMEYYLEVPLNTLLENRVHEETLHDSQEDVIVIKKFDAQNNSLESSNRDELEDLGTKSASEGDPVKTAIGFIQMVTGETKTKLIVEGYKTENPDICRIAITLLNDNPYSNPKPRKLDWTTRCIILPNVITSITNGGALLPIQQHYDSIQYTLKNGDSALADQYEERTYVNTNGVLTQSVIDKNILYFSMFGAFDTIREIPVKGPSIKTLLENDKSFLDNLDKLTIDEKKALVDKGYLPTIKAILSAAFIAFQVKENLHKFQWDAIQNRIKLIVNNKIGTTTIVKAPTGSGKTLVFMANAVLHSIITKQRSVLVFPTRILNQDMFQRLTKFVFEIRKLLPSENVTGGIFIGISDPLYRALVNPIVGKEMVQYDACPSCGAKNSITAVEQGRRKVGKCSCGHEISYMFDPREVSDYMPLITIATPDNLFYSSTCGRWESYQMRFFGGYYVNCKCGFNMPAIGENENFECKKCNASLSLKDKKNSPIGYFVFDEVHSLYGLTGILLSIYLRSVNIVTNKIHDWYFEEPLKWQLTFETGTATIANEVELLKYITRVSDDKIIVVPDTKSYANYFDAKTDLVKYRTIVMLPVARASRTSMSNSILRTYYALYDDDKFKDKFKKNVGDTYDFILGYLYRKSDGYTIRKTLQELSGQQFGKEKTIEFLSGDASTPMVSRIFQMAINKQIEILLANLVISLGLDIGNLNNMIMMGVPKSMTEFVQTAGRTGRKDQPGHVCIHFLPSVPRDIFVFENFHRVFSDVSGYYEMKPIQSTNAYAAKLIFPNILKFLINAFSYYQYMLTIPSINRTLRQYPKLQTRLLFDVLKCLRDDSNATETINKNISVESKKQYEEFIAEWSKRSGPGLYLSDWFVDEGKSLTSLRTRSNKEIRVDVNEIDLLNKMTKQITPPWVAYPEEELEEINNEEENDHE